jgi:hypothetical protein
MTSEERVLAVEQDIKDMKNDMSDIKASVAVILDRWESGRKSVIGGTIKGIPWWGWVIMLLVGGEKLVQGLGMIPG